MPYRQRLVWKLSSRTMRLLRPTDRLTSYLPTIEEHNINNSLSAANLARLRFVIFFVLLLKYHCGASLALNGTMSPPNMSVKKSINFFGDFYH